LLEGLEKRGIKAKGMTGSPNKRYIGILGFTIEGKRVTSKLFDYLHRLVRDCLSARRFHNYRFCIPSRKLQAGQ